MSDKKFPLPAARIEPPLAPGVPSTTGFDFLTTKLDWFVQWSHKNSLWPMPFGTASMVGGPWGALGYVGLGVSGKTA